MSTHNTESSVGVLITIVVVVILLIVAIIVALPYINQAKNTTVNVQVPTTNSQ